MSPIRVESERVGHFTVGETQEACVQLDESGIKIVVTGFQSGGQVDIPPAYTGFSVTGGITLKPGDEIISQNHKLIGE